jgi:hypothetical protein
MSYKEGYKYEAVFVSIAADKNFYLSNAYSISPESTSHTVKA